MMKEPVVTYIRIRELFQPFLKYTYGSEPIDLPEPDELYDILATGLVPNYSMRKLCYSTFSQAAYEESLDRQQPSLFSDEGNDKYLPEKKDLQKLVPFIIPHTVIIGGKCKRTDKWFQLSNASYNIFRKKIEKSFWHSFVNFDQKVMLYCSRENIEYKKELAIEKFMIKVGMDMDSFDTLAREWRKERAKYEATISQYSNKEPTSNLREELDYKIISKTEEIHSIYNR